eukprot:Gregarina_sp_Poly_1__737@NODE_1177_length_4857_cov_483_461587_g807_i0_p4_GENE_NODE_1177_length_4857_cov_483_461587_g807_i0NODE_1177_length_4857_cov_483_461587_g807_i0_p4_ORF_typecomplete_len157_score11_57_NODE_1177_length_4857_cov_483_461587_g807_i035614031
MHFSVAWIVLHLGLAYELIPPQHFNMVPASSFARVAAPSFEVVPLGCPYNGRWRLEAPQLYLDRDIYFDFQAPGAVALQIVNRYQGELSTSCPKRSHMTLLSESHLPVTTREMAAEEFLLTFFTGSQIDYTFLGNFFRAKSRDTITVWQRATDTWN